LRRIKAQWPPTLRGIKAGFTGKWHIQGRYNARLIYVR
jgi:hypothetical protein